MNIYQGGELDLSSLLELPLLKKLKLDTISCDTLEFFKLLNKNENRCNLEQLELRSITHFGDKVVFLPKVSRMVINKDIFTSIDIGSLENVRNLSFSPTFQKTNQA